MIVKERIFTHVHRCFSLYILTSDAETIIIRFFIVGFTGGCHLFYLTPYLYVVL